MKAENRRSEALEIKVSVGREQRIERPAHLGDAVGEAARTLGQLQ
jgi:hypothetical protein